MQAAAGSDEQDDVWVLETNLDDVPAETVGYCFEQLAAARPRRFQHAD